MSEKTEKTAEEWLAKVKKNGSALEYVPENLKTKIAELLFGDEAELHKKLRFTLWN